MSMHFMLTSDASSASGPKLIGVLAGVNSGDSIRYFSAESEYFDGGKFLKSCSINIQASLSYSIYDHATLNLNGSMIFGLSGHPNSGNFYFNQNYNVSVDQTLSVQVWGTYFNALFAKVYLV